MTTDRASRLRAIEERCEKATPGEWSGDRVKCEGEYGSGEDIHSGFDGFQIIADNGDVLVDTTNSTAACIEEEWDEDGCVATDIVGYANANFIAHSRQDIPYLLTELRLSEERQKEMAGLMEEAANMLSDVVPTIAESIITRLRTAAEGDK
jgi:hypothetical protein